MLLPEILNCKEFVNADAIAAGISPYAPGSVAIQAGKIMLDRIRQLITLKKTFAIETTLSTRSYAGLIKKCRSLGYKIILIYFWLSNINLAIERVANRVARGGHHIENSVIRRRYKKGIQNLFSLFLPLTDAAFFFNNSEMKPELIAEYTGGHYAVFNKEVFDSLLKRK